MVCKREFPVSEKEATICTAGGLKSAGTQVLNRISSWKWISPQRLLSLAGAGSGITFIRASIPYYIGPSEELVFYKINHPDTTRNLSVYYRDEEV